MTAYVKDKDIVTRRIGDEIFLVPVRANVGDLECLFTLNATGTALWECLDEARDQDELVERLISEFDTDMDSAGVDVTSFLSDLEKAGLITRGSHG